jgi:hypothetical protein
MSLTFGGSEGAQLGRGIYVNKGKIIAARDVSGQKPSDFAENPCEVGLQIKLDIGRSFQPIMAFAGNFKRNEAGQITDWGNATTLKIFLSNMGVKGELDANNKVPIEVIKALIGREIFRLSYVKGVKETDGVTKPSYGTWNTVLPATEGNDKKLADMFQASLKKGYPKNYKPEVLDSQAGDTSFDPPATSTPASETPRHDW